MRKPHPALRGVALRYVGFDEWGLLPVRRREIAQDTVTVIFNFGPSLLVGGRDEIPTPRESFVAASLSKYGITEFNGRSSGLELSLSAAGAHMVFGQPLDELAPVVVPIEQAMGREGEQLGERLAETTGWAERFALLDRMLIRRVASARRQSPEVAHAWNRLVQSGGRVHIGALAAELGCSRRHLSTRFREGTGVTPKTAARLFRFRRSVSLLQRDDGRRFAEIAATCGYFDQAHMNRDFRQFAGTTPGSFLASRLPDGLGVAAEPPVTSVQDT